MATLKHLQKPASQRILGTAVLIIGLLAALFGYNRDISVWQNQYQLKAQFSSAEGLTTGTDVMLAGIKIGEISALQLGDDYNVNVTMQIYDHIRLPEDSSAAIVSHGIFGGKYMRISPGGVPFELQNNDEFLYVVQPIDFTKLLQTLIGNAEARLQKRQNES